MWQRCADVPYPASPCINGVSGYGVRPDGPRWVGDRNALLFVQFEPDLEGFLAPDLFLWQLDAPSDEVRRVTHGAAVLDADPSPDGTWAVAVRHRFGRSELVSVDLQSGDVSVLSAGSEDDTVAFPRLDPGGRRVAYVRQRSGGEAPGWELVVRDVDARRGLGPAKVLPTPGTARISHPEWHPEGHHLYVSLAFDGFIDLYRLSLDGLETVALTRGQGAAMAPAPTPDGGALFYLSLEPDGLDLRRLALEEGGPATPLPVLPLADWPEEQRQAMVPAVPPRPVAPPETFESRELSPERPYGWGHLEWFPLVGGRITPHQESLEVGLRAGDVLGRFELLALASGTSDQLEGGALQGTWRGRPTAWRGHIFDLDASLLGDGFASSYRGIELAMTRSWRWRTLSGHLQSGALWSELETPRGRFMESRTLHRRTFFTATGWRAAQRRGDWRFFERLDLAAEVGRTEDDTWRRLAGSAGLDVTRRGWGGLHLSWHHAELLSSEHDFERFRLGGLQGSLPSPFALRQWIEVPALPPAMATADDITTFRVDLKPGGGPWSLFYAHHRLTAEIDSVALRGLEVRWKRGPWPLLRLPGFDFSAGAAEILNTRLDRDIEGWLTLTFRP